MKKRVYIAIAVLIAASAAAFLVISKSDAPPKPGAQLSSFDGKVVPQNMLNVYRLYPEDSVLKIEAPEGYKAVYLAHYGRHGSRYVKYDYQYDNVEKALHMASDSGLLSATGQKLWKEYSAVYPILRDRKAGLTPLGQEQHKGIAARMASNFPELFCGEGAKVDVIATPMPRTEMSRDAFCDELALHFPALDIVKSPARVPALNPYSKAGGVASEWDLYWNSEESPSKPSQRALSESIVDCSAFAARIFSDPAWAGENIDLYTMMTDLYSISVGLPGTPASGVDLCKYMTLDELSACNRVWNYYAFCGKGHCEQFGSHGRQWALASYVLEDLVEKTVSDIRSGEYNARLRFGHDGCLMGMYALLGIMPWGFETTDSALASQVWNSSLTPMACNLQVALYRNDEGSLLARVLYNEKDFPLPLEKVNGIYYDPQALLDFCRAGLEKARKVLEY